jgi:predicted amidophosphoribosyltransferase
MAGGGGWVSCAAGVPVWAGFAYDGPAGAMVRALKFGGRAAIADAMAAQLAAHAPPELLRVEVVPVPVHPAHRRRRGIDHADALAAALARRSGLPLRRCLVRQGDARPQVGSDRRERLRGPGGSIVAGAATTAPRAALLVDDVVTTGATIAACAKALRTAGCGQVSAVVYARTSAR